MDCSLISVIQHWIKTRYGCTVLVEKKKKKRQHFGLKISKKLQCNFSTNSIEAWFEFGECMCVCVCVSVALIIHIHCELMTVIVCRLISTLAQKGNPWSSKMDNQLWKRGGDCFASRIINNYTFSPGWKRAAMVTDSFSPVSSPSPPPELTAAVMCTCGVWQVELFEYYC